MIGGSTELELDSRFKASGSLEIEARKRILNLGTVEGLKLDSGWYLIANGGV